MNQQPPDWPPWPSPYQPHGLETENRLTKLEIGQESHGEQLEGHEKRHNEQDVWNKGFSVALMGLGSGLAHAKMGELFDLLLGLLGALSKVWKG